VVQQGILFTPSVPTQRIMGVSTLTFLLALAVSPLALQASGEREAARVAANPIRKVVTMLQAMQKKVMAEGEKEKELYEKFQCYCKTSGSSLSESIAAAESKAPALGKDIEASSSRKVQVEEELKQAQLDRSAAKEAMAQATKLREKDAAAYAAEKGEADANIAAIESAVAALEKGAAGGFLQTGGAQTLRRLVLGQRSEMPDLDRQGLLSFLSGQQGDGYAPQSGEITGILKQLGDEMGKGLSEATAAEEASIASYEALMAAKKKEVDALIEAIEKKTQQVGELGVAIEQMKNSLSSTEAALLEDQKFQAELEKGCATKASEWDERVKVRSDELTALAETIKVLNDDDALELFKKTLPASSVSFVQVRGESARAQRMRALVVARGAARRLAGAWTGDRSRLDLLVMALHGKQAGFEKVVAMIDGMVANLKKEQVDDNQKKEYCGAQLDLADDKKKGFEHALSDAEGAIAVAKDGIAALAEEIEALEAGIKALDKSVAEATEQRKAEHEAFTELMASDSASKELLGFAKNRLNKFYNPALYKPPPKRELAREDRIVVNLGGTAPPTPPPGGIADTGIAVLAQISAHRGTSVVAPPPPPETFGAYATKSSENTGVIAMIDLLVKDLDKEMTTATTEEKDSQADYEVMMSDSAEKRASDAKALTEKGAAKAALEGDLEAHKEEKASLGKELAASLEYIQSLHAECDWLMQYFEVRKSARASEIESLGQAKAVLSGADYSLLQTRSRGFLQRSL